jgi:ribose transport system permease protein
MEAAMSSDQPSVAVTPRPGWARVLSDYPLVVLALVLVVLMIVTGIIEPGYFSLRGMRNTVLFAAPIGILAAAQTILMLTRGIDLSVSMIATVAAYVVAVNHTSLGIVVAIVASIALGSVVGAVNGIGVGVFRVHPLIMTLAMSAILLGLMTQWAQSATGATVPSFVRTIGGDSLPGNLIPYNALVWLGVAVIVIVGLHRTGLGRMIYAIGDNPTAARLAGVRVWQVLLAVYIISGLLAAIAGILISGQVGSVDLRLADQFLLPSIAAAVIGGTSLFGGVGSYSGTIFGALILSVLNTMLTFLNASQAMKQVVFGSIVLALAWLYASIIRSTK